MHCTQIPAIAHWAKRLAMSERSLARLVDAETGLTLGRWRQQLQLLVAVHVDVHLPIVTPAARAREETMAMACCGPMCRA